MSEIAHQLYMAQIGHREEFDRHSVEWVAGLLEDVERLEGDVEGMVLKSDYDEAIKDAAKAKRGWQRRKRALRRLFTCLITDRAFRDALFDGDEFERADMLTVALVVVPLMKLLVRAQRDAEAAVVERERGRVFRVRDRRGVEEGYPKRFNRSALLRIASDMKVDLSGLLVEKLTKADLARLIALAKYPEPA
jgi:hypothetical protein